MVDDGQPVNLTAARGATQAHAEIRIGGTGNRIAGLHPN
jgi:hypothetical protein